MLSHLFRSSLQCLEPRIIKILILCSIISLGIVVIIGVLLSWGLEHIPYHNIPWIGGWLNGSDIANGLIISSQIVMLVILGLFFFPYILLGVTSLFQDHIIGAVESRYYPDLPRPLSQRARDALWFQVKFYGKIAMINLVFSPLYIILLFSGVGVIILAALINGYLIGIEYYSMVSLRRLPPSQHEIGIRQHRVMVHFYGVLLYLGMLVPIINLLIPVWGCMVITHLFYQHHRNNSFVTTTQD